MTLMVVSLILFLYTTASLFLLAPYSRWLKGVFTALLLLVSLKYVIYQQVGGGAFFAPVLPRSALLIMEALYAALVVLFCLLLLKDALLLCLWIARRCGLSWTFPLPLTPLKTGMTVLALALGIWGTWESVRVPDIRTVELRLDNLPPALDGFSISYFYGPLKPENA